MARKGVSTTKRLFSYKPEARTYEMKSDAYILGKVILAKQLAQGIREIGEQAKEANSMLTDGIDHMVKLFQSQHELGLPADKRYVSFDAKSAKPADVIFRVLGMLLADQRAQYIFPHGTPRDDKIADAIEKHVNALPKWLYRKYGQRYDIQSLFWQLLAGRSYIQQSYLPFYWDKNILQRKKDEADSDYNARSDGYKGYQGPPVFRESLDPRTVFPIETPMGTEAYVMAYRVQRIELGYAFERIGKRLVFNGDKVSVQELSAPAGQKLPEQSDGAELGTSMAEYFEYVDDTFCYYVVGNTVVHRYEHGGGVKICPGLALQTGFKEAHLASVGLLWAVRNEIPQFDFMRTLWLQKAYLDVFPQLIAQLGERDNPIMDEKGSPRTWDIEPGTVIQVRGALVNALKDAQSGMDFRAALEMFAGDIDLATIPALARGIGGAQQPGYSINQLNQAMRTLWRPVIESRELQMSMLDEHYLWMAKYVIDSDMALFAEGEDPETGRRTGEYFVLRRDDIHDYFQISTQLRPELPIDRQGLYVVGADLLDRGIITHEEFSRDFLETTNPVERRTQLDRDMAHRLMLPKALEDAMALGRVKLSNEILAERGLDRLNQIFSLDIQALKEGRAAQQAPAPVAAGAGGDGQLPGQAGNGAAAPAAAAGGGIAPTTGANPANATPGPRRGDPASGLRGS